ncbi:hypothetical protein OTK49_00150 [Vibrio coralliirubri]|uniref:hypothetical protein n=1 Tax=Vibrio coralliirubri TaxID=1516159 RepID=UPI002283EAAA|nr:hypothetical protein [Vibrio coralliirubri]MCY9860951.1 hypothetical protein [Vibrio coralliirubri]
MGTFILAVLVFVASVGVSHKAKNLDADLPDAVISGSKAFMKDLIIVIKSLIPAKKVSPEGEAAVAELPKDDSVEKPAE